MKKYLKNSNLYNALTTTYLFELYRNQINIKFINNLNKKLQEFNRKSISEFIDLKKKSDTIFILGSGESINEVSENEWQHLKKHNTCSYNSFFIHDFIPDYYLFEPADSNSYMKMFYDETAEKYNDTYMFYQSHIGHSLGIFIDEYKHKDYLFHYNPYFLYSSTRKRLKINLKWFFLRGFSLSNLVHHSSHTDLVYYFAAVLGFKKIVFVGVDFNGGKYFTDSDINSSTYPSNEKYKKMNKIREEFQLRMGHKSLKDENLHLTMNNEIMRKRLALTTVEFLETIVPIFKKKFGVDTFVLNESSKLANFLPIYKF